MSLRKALLLACLVSSLACLAGGYGMIAPWMGAGAVLLAILTLLFAKRFAAAWLPSTSLASLVCLAAAGLLAGAPAFPMILSATTALAYWDLLNLNRSMADGSPSEAARRFEKVHVRSLAIAIGLGLLMARSGSLFSIQIPLLLMMVLVLVCVFSLNRVVSYLGNWRAQR